MTKEEDPACKSLIETILYKIDRSFAILGVIAIAVTALVMSSSNESMNIATAAIGGLVGYVGGRSGK